MICAIGVCHRDVELAAMWLKWVSFLCTQPGGDNSDHVLLVTHTKRVVRSSRFMRTGLKRLPQVTSDYSN